MFWSRCQPSTCILRGTVRPSLVDQDSRPEVVAGVGRTEAVVVRNPAQGHIPAEGVADVVAAAVAANSQGLAQD